MAWGKTSQTTRNGGIRSIAVSLLLTAIAGAASATTIVAPTDDQLIDRSELIVVATVTRTAAVEIDRAIYTETELAVQRTLRGHHASRLVVRELGGTLGDRATIAFGAPAFTPGERVLAFLTPGEDATFRTVDLYLGKFTERRLEGGDSVWFRPSALRGTRVLSPSADSRQRQSRRFESYVEGRANHAQTAPNYLIDNPRYERTVGADFALLSDPNVYRWFAFDEGRPVAWRSFGKQRGFDDGGLPELQNALATWSNFSDANIRLVYAGSLEQIPSGLKTPDDVNAIIFNDPHGEIDGYWNGQSGIIGRASYNAVKRAGNWTSPFAVDTAHPSKTFDEVWEIVEGNIVIQDGVSPMNNIGSTRLTQLIAHELGHTLGFAHSQDAEALMSSTIDGAGPHLRGDDQSAARWLYPSASSQPAPFDTTVLADFALSNDHPVVHDDIALQDASKGAPTQWQWQFGDGNTSNERNPSHRFQAPGIYTVALTVLRGTSTSTKTKLVRVGPDQESDTLIPVAVQTSGVASTEWRTELALFNSGDSALTVRLTFLPGAGGAAAERSMTIAPQETVAFFNTLPDLFGITAGAGGLLIESSSGTGANSQLRISSRTFTMSEQGTFGQFVPSLEMLPRISYITGISSSSSFRANIGIVNQSPNDAAANLTLYGADGSVLGTNTLFVGGHSFQQLPIKSLFPSIDGAELDILSMRIEADRANSITGYASVVDNATQDPVLVPARGDGARSLLLPGVAHVQGGNGTFWRTDAALFNPDETEMRIAIGALGSAAIRELTIAPRASVSISDLLGWLDPAARQATITIESAGPTGPVVSGRTYTSREDGGTFGQWIPAMDAAAGRSLVNLTGVRLDESFRTNLGFVNSTASPVSVRVHLHGRTGLVATRDVTVPATGHLQQPLATLFPEAGSREAEPLSATMESDGASFFGFASVVDNRSGDATFVTGE